MKVRSQWRVSRFLISSLSDYEKAGPLVAALTEYNDELFPREIRPCLDVLDQIHAIIRTEYLAHERKNAFDAQRGLRRAFSFFFANHKNIKACLSCDVIRADMCGDGKGDTKDYANSVLRVSEDAGRITDVPPPSRGVDLVADSPSFIVDPPKTTWWKCAIFPAARVVTAIVAFFGGLAGILTFATTPDGICLFAHLTACLEYIGSLIIRR